MTRVNCAFSWIERSTTRVVLRDLDAPGRPTLTNDADAVVRALLNSGDLMPGTTRLFYYDSEDDFAELEYSGLGFIGFKHAVAP